MNTLKGNAHEQEEEEAAYRQAHSSAYCRILIMQEELLFQTLKEIKDKLEMLDESIRGNGTPGLRSRVERLEESEKRRDWWTKSLAMLIIGNLFVALKGYFK